jgi:hypothetical protein
LTEYASGKDDGRFAQLRGHWAYEERLTSFRAENGVAPKDEIICVRLTCQ